MICRYCGQNRPETPSEFLARIASLPPEYLWHTRPVRNGYVREYRVTMTGGDIIARTYYMRLA